MMKKILWGLAVYALTLLTGGIWAALVTINLKTTPAFPWAVIAMGVILWFAWRLFASGSRQNAARTNPVSKRVFATALLAGIFSIVALVGLWNIFLSVAQIPQNTTLVVTSYPLFTVIATFVMASLVGAISEEVGFRGYIQGVFETTLPAKTAIVLTAIIMFPAHGLTQGFLWPVLVFYLFADIMFGTMTRITNSIIPGIAVHTLGLFVFFMFVWPSSGAHVSLWTSLAQTIIFAGAAFAVFKKLARISEQH